MALAQIRSAGLTACPPPLPKTLERAGGGEALPARDPPTVRGQAVVPNATLSAGMMVVPGGGPGPGAAGSLGGGARA